MSITLVIVIKINIGPFKCLRQNVAFRFPDSEECPPGDIKDTGMPRGI